MPRAQPTAPLAIALPRPISAIGDAARRTDVTPAPRIRAMFTKRGAAFILPDIPDRPTKDANA
jgi:hypothetical protein